MGMSHGFPEMLQGNHAPDGKVIDSIGPAQRFWEYGSEPAFTLIPNFLVTGILATLVSLFVVIWTAAFIDRKHGAWVLGLLSITMFLFGGGFGPPVCAILAIVAAAGMDRTLTWWRKHLPRKLRGFLASFWPWPLIAFLLLCLFALANGIFGYPLMWFVTADNASSSTLLLGQITFLGLGPVVILSAITYDIQKTTDSQRNPSPE